MAPKPRDVWGIPIPNAKDVVSYISNAMNTLSIASGDKPALTPGANAVRRSGEAVSYLNSAINPFAETSKKLIGQAAEKPGANKALAKSVGVDAVVALTAALGGKAASSAANAIARSGIVPRVVNKATGQQVLVHGTPDFEKLIGNRLMPKAGSPGSPDEKVVFGYNPQFKGSGTADYLEGSVKQYTGPKGGAVIAKFPKKSLKNLEYQENNPGLVNQMAAKGNPVDPKNPPWVLSQSPARIVAKVPVAGGDFKNQLAKELKLAGAPLRDATRERAIAKLLRERSYKKSIKDQNSPV
jgi:hypothetical protein